MHKNQTSSLAENHAKVWRENLKRDQALLRDEYFQQKNSHKLLKQQSRLVDAVLQQIWLNFN